MKWPVVSFIVVGILPSDWDRLWLENQSSSQRRMEQ